MTDSTKTDTQPRRPSVDYFLDHAGDGCAEADMNNVPAGSKRDEYLTWLYHRESTEQWLVEYTAPFNQYDVAGEMTPEYKALLDEHEAYQEQIHSELGYPRRKTRAIMPHVTLNSSVILSPDTVLWWWQEHGLLQWDGYLYVPYDSVEVPDWVILQVSWWFTKIGPYPDREDSTGEGEDGRTRSRKSVPSGAVPPFGLSLHTVPPISPAFTLENGASVGRISSSQVSQAQFRACVAPKSEWSTTAKGYPKLTFTVSSGLIDIQIKPEFPSGDVREIKEMEAIRDELSINDWEAMVMLQAQAMRERRPNGGAFIRDIDACDYQGLTKNVSGKSTSGHYSKNRKRFQDSMRRWAHLYVVTDTLQVSEIDAKGVKRAVVMEWREKALKINGNIARRDTDTILGWDYELGKTFTTFVTKPNAYIAILMQKVIELSGSYESVKLLVNYLTIHFRANTKTGRGLERTMGEILHGACLPADPRRQRRTIDATERTIRTAVEKGFIRLQDGDRLWDADSANLHEWTAVPHDLKGKRLFEAWKEQKVTFRAVVAIEHEYDRYRKVKAEATSTEAAAL